MKVETDGKIIDVKPQDITSVCVSVDHKGRTGTTITISEEAKNYYGISRGYMQVNTPYIDTLLILLTEREKEILGKTGRSFWEAMKADYRATVEWLKNVGK